MSKKINPLLYCWQCETETEHKSQNGTNSDSACGLCGTFYSVKNNKQQWEATTDGETISINAGDLIIADNVLEPYARLIASAPELLDALKALIGITIQIGRKLYSNPLYPEYKTILEQTKDVIAKTEGRE